MKPAGAIPSGYAAAPSGRLAIAGEDIEALIARAGDTPLFVYDMALVRARIASLRAAMPEGLGVHYAIKANPLPPIVNAIAPLVEGLDVASAGEMAVALDAGSSHISFAGPGKRDRELEAAIAAGVTINLESESEADRALEIVSKQGLAPRLAVRVNPDFDLKGSGMRMGGGAKPFGVDADRAAALARRVIEAGADWRGWHIFAGSQALDAAAVTETQVRTVALAARLSENVGATPPLVNLGGGFGLPYFAGDCPLDIGAVGARLDEALAARAPVLANSRFAIELGRYLVGEAGVYLMRVLDRKVSHGEIFLVTDGGLHHQLAASGNFGTVVRRNYPIANASRFAAPATMETSVVGCLCTPLDRLGDHVMLPETQPGDVIAVFMAGAYGATASPAAFLGHPPAREIVVGMS